MQERRQPAWSLPLDDDFKEQLKSHVADLKNVGGNWGGAITAAKFSSSSSLRRPGFTSTSPWTELERFRKRHARRRRIECRFDPRRSRAMV